MIYSRAAFADQVCNLQKELAWWQKQATGCTSCMKFSEGVCTDHGLVPEEFIPAGCDDWQFDDVPF